MFWRPATLGGLVWLALGTAVCSSGEETTAESNDSNAQPAENQTTDNKETILPYRVPNPSYFRRCGTY